MYCVEVINGNKNRITTYSSYYYYYYALLTCLSYYFLFCMLLSDSIQSTSFNWHLDSLR